MSKTELTYQITTRDYLTQEKASYFNRCHRRDVALDRLWKQIYAMLESEALLDRPVAKRLEREFEQLAAAVETKPLRRGYERRETFYLREKERDGKRVDFLQGYL